jgi:hypothetical protein
MSVLIANDEPPALGELHYALGPLVPEATFLSLVGGQFEDISRCL